MDYRTKITFIDNQASWEILGDLLGSFHRIGFGCNIAIIAYHNDRFYWEIEK